MLAGLAGKLVTWTGGVLLQWLGRISYSLYLIHFLGSVVAKAGSLRVHSWAGGAMVFLAATAVALVSAELLYRLIEGPAHGWSKTVKVRS
jgi:peptidoglycan/LPS O-acetylase OafA/YrhL